MNNPNWIKLLCCFVTLFFISQLSVAQSKTKTELMIAAKKSFAGNDLRGKNGPLAKVGFELALLKEEYNAFAGIQSQSSFTPSNSLLRVSNKKVVVDVIASGDPSVLESELQSIGMQVSGKAGAIISGLLPISAIEQIAAMPRVRSVRPAIWKTRIGATTSQGDASMQSDNVRSILGFDGSGITIGVLSDSYNYIGGASADVLSGDLPGTGNPNGFTTPVNILDDDGDSDEGRGMLQLIHDVAPGAALAFATANGGSATFANNIINLRNSAGADVIVDDVIYLAEPMFQDGVVAQAVDAVVADGAPYFSSAGNNGTNSYESIWRWGTFLAEDAIPGVSGVTFWGGTAFDFDPGSGEDNMQSFTLNNGETILLVVQWDSPFASVCIGCPGSPNDVDIYVLNAAGNLVLASSAFGNIDDDAVEIVQFTNTTGSSATFNIMLVNYDGIDPGYMKYVNFGDAQGSLEFATNSGTIYGHANAAGAEAVAAAFYYETPEFGTTPPLLEDYSSAGTTPIFFTTDGTPTYEPRDDKPEITAPDGANTTFFGFDVPHDGDTYPNFFGTSAAAPHAAAVAALILEKNNSATPAEIYSALETNTIDMGVPGFDNNSGYGLIQADLAIESILPVELISFTASRNAQSVNLSWQTMTEVNNYGFEIQRSPSPTSSQREGTPQVSPSGGFRGAWEAVGFVAGNGNSNSPKSYSFVDATAKGNVVYRLKQIDNDGQFEYHGAVEVMISQMPQKHALMQNYPNPFNPTTNIQYSISNAQFVTLKVYDMLGKEVATLVNGMQEAGEQNVEFHATQYPSGMYFYTLRAGNFVETKKMVLVK